MLTTKQMIEVMQADADGKQIQIRCADNTNNAYINVKYPLWDWVEFEYRVAPDMEQAAHELYFETYKDGTWKDAWRAVIDAVKRGEIS